MLAVWKVTDMCVCVMWDDAVTADTVITCVSDGDVNGSAATSPV